jgi:hypothetical protein
MIMDSRQAEDDKIVKCADRADYVPTLTPELGTRVPICGLPYKVDAKRDLNRL